MCALVTGVQTCALPIVPVLDDYREKLMGGSTPPTSPEAAVACGQITQILEDAIARLPAPFRTVFVLREIEDLDVADVAEALGIPASTVKTRHLRARRRLQQELAPELKSALSGTFPFAGADCEGLTAKVVAALRSEEQTSEHKSLMRIK